MVRYKAIIAYDGTDFNGFQRQPGVRTVQEELEKTLTRMNNGTFVEVFGSGRTDSGVHAMGQVIHFDFPQERPLERMRFALDTQSPEDIACKEVAIMPADFHARYHVVEKTYQYKVQIGKPRSPFLRRYASYYPYPLDLDKIRQALPDFLGTHDFTSFCASGATVDEKVRTVLAAEMTVNETGDELTFTFRGDGFLYKMIRIMMGTLLKIGNDRMPADAIPGIIAAQDRNLAGPTAHPEGLYLVEVKYE